MRAGELKDLVATDVRLDSASPVVSIRTLKGGKNRRVPLNADAAAAFRAFRKADGFGPLLDSLVEKLSATGAKLARQQQNGERVEVGTLTGPIHSVDGDARNINVYCMYALLTSEPQAGVDLHMAWGDTFVAFVQADEFLRRVRTEAARRGYQTEVKMVEYVNRSSYKGEMNVFRKFRHDGIRPTQPLTKKG